MSEGGRTHAFIAYSIELPGAGDFTGSATDAGEAMRLMKMGGGELERPAAPKRRRRRPAIHNPHDPGVRRLYENYVASGMTLRDYAAHAGTSRQNLDDWFSNIRLPIDRLRARVQARTEVDMGFRGPDVAAEVDRARNGAAQAQRLVAQSRGRAARHQRRDDEHRANNDTIRKTIGKRTITKADLAILSFEQVLEMSRDPNVEMSPELRAEVEKTRDLVDWFNSLVKKP